MSTEDDVVTDPGGEVAVVDADAVGTDGATDETASEGPNWWHRDHPVFAALAGFFTGMFFIILVPGLYGAVLNWLLDYDTAESLYPFVLVALAVPIGLVVYRPSRRFGRYMVLGIVSTLIVVGAVAAAVLYYLIHAQA